MHFWREDWFKSLQLVVDNISEPEWSGYKDYCNFQLKGLRKNAFGELRKFTSKFITSSLEERNKFVRFIMPLSLKNPGADQMIPHPLKNGIIIPTLTEWLDSNSDDSQAFYYMGVLTRDIGWLRKAIYVDKNNTDARILLIEWLLNFPSYATHHLPEGFIGEPQEVLESLREIEKLLVDDIGEKRKRPYLEEIEQYRSATNSYVSAFNKSSHSAN